MFNLDPAKLAVIGVIALIVLGPERLPRVARQLGSAWHELTRIRDQVTDEVKSAFPIDDIPKIPNASRAISSFVSGFATGASALPTVSPSAPQSTSEVGTSEVDPAATSDAVGRAPGVIIHPALGDFAFVVDDPDMN